MTTLLMRLRARMPTLSTGASLAATVWPGLGVSALVAMAATFIATMHGGPQLLYALLFGMALHHLHADARSRHGIEFSARTVLRLGVGLLGARITAGQIAELGWRTAAVVVLGVVTTMLLALWLGRRLGLTRSEATLSGGAVAICGASAALAISAVLPRDKNSDRFTLVVVVAVTLLSTLAMVLYPLVARLMHLPPELAGLFLGGTIHDVAQVVVAGYMLDHATGDIATVVKLLRVALLAVVVVVVSVAFRHARTQLPLGSTQTGVSHARCAPAPSSALVPWFLWMFVLLVTLHSVGWIPTSFQEAANQVSRACLVIAIAALGLKTSFAQLAQAGWRPMLLIAAETVWLALLVLGCALAIR